MTLNAGDIGATDGLAKGIYDAMETNLGGSLDAEQLEDLKPVWSALSFCIASGVVQQLTAATGADPSPPLDPAVGEVYSSSTQDNAFWGWLSDFASVLRTWSSGAGSVTDLRTSLDAFFDANETPTDLRGILR